MLDKALTKVFGSRHDREVKKMLPLVAAINDLEPRMKALDDDGLRALVADFRGRIDQGATLDDLLVEAFAASREAAWRTIGQRPYDVQLMGGMVLQRGSIAEMKTGEGKTLMSTLAAFLNALDGKGVHIVTVNDYLARRDSEWMGSIYRFMGYSVGCVQTGLSEAERKTAYEADITYATNNELGFDYLRDNMKFGLESMVQRGHNFAIIDEVDSILIDEARTPLIISGPSEESVDKYYRIDRLIPRLARGEEIEEGDTKYTTGDFLVDEKAHTVTLTEEGVAKVEKLAGVQNLYDLENMDLLHGINQGLRAHHLFKRDVEYLLKDGQVVIVDEFTGRMMPGRRWSDGLHQAVEAKEGVRIERENQTLATITFQNYFRNVRQALRDDRYGGHRGHRVRPDLRPRRLGHSHQQADDPRRPRGSRLPQRAREMGRRRRGDRRLSRARPAGSGRHDLDRIERDALQAAQAQGCAPCGAQREVPREGGVDRRPGGSQGSGDDRHQHGGSRAPISCSAATPRDSPGRRSTRRRTRRPTRRRWRAIRGLAPRRSRRSSRRAVCTFSVPSDTSRGGSTTSFADARAVRAIRARRASSSRWRTI